MLTHLIDENEIFIKQRKVMQNQNKKDMKRIRIV